MKQKKNELSYEEKFKIFIKQLEEAEETDTSLLKLIIKMEMSDIIYQQHTKSCYTMVLIMIITQVLCTIFNIFFNTFDATIKYIIGSLFPAIVNLIILFLIICNNKIHTKSWAEAKCRLTNIELAIDKLSKEEKKF